MPYRPFWQLHASATCLTYSAHVQLLDLAVVLLLQGQYDRVHVGASCPQDRLNALLSLLRPCGGKLVTPVSPSDMRVITVDDKGAITQKVILQVRYGELEVRTKHKLLDEPSCHMDLARCGPSHMFVAWVLMLLLHG